MAVTLGFGAERTDHLAVADGAAFADEDVAPFHLQSGIGLEALDRLSGLLLEEQRGDFDQAPRLMANMMPTTSMGTLFQRSRDGYCCSCFDLFNHAGCATGSREPLGAVMVR